MVSQRFISRLTGEVRSQRGPERREPGPTGTAIRHTTVARLRLPRTDTERAKGGGGGGGGGGEVPLATRKEKDTEGKRRGVKEKGQNPNPSCAVSLWNWPVTDGARLIFYVLIYTLPKMNE